MWCDDRQARSRVRRLGPELRRDPRAAQPPGGGPARWPHPGAAVGVVRAGLRRTVFAGRAGGRRRSSRPDHDQDRRRPDRRWPGGAAAASHRRPRRADRRDRRRRRPDARGPAPQDRGACGRDSPRCPRRPSARSRRPWNCWTRSLPPSARKRSMRRRPDKRADGMECAQPGIGSGRRTGRRDLMRRGCGGPKQPSRCQPRRSAPSVMSELRPQPREPVGLAAPARWLACPDSSVDRAAAS